MKKLEYIICKNFKGFYGTTEDDKSNKIVLGGKNLLVYGENGSGKSSLYWALYTFLMSALRKDEDVLNFFRSDSDKNWRNRYCKSTEDSSIIVKFEDENEIEISNNKKYEFMEYDTLDSDLLRIIEQTRQFVEGSILLSDFVNYKYIFKTFDFQNYKTVDLFPLFEDYLFPFINIEGFFKQTKYNFKFAHSYWKHILERKNNVTTYRNRVHGKVYYEIKDEIDRFDNAIQSYLFDLTNYVNDYLTNKFNYNFTIKFEYRPTTFEINNFFKRPAIFIELKDALGVIDKPHVFLNEAKLSIIAIAIRFAMMDKKIASDQYGRLLVLDDLLISLDMSNRDVVLDVILEKANQYQIIMMTHDRALFELTKNKISHHKDTNLDAWVYREMYNKQVLSTDIPTPFILDSKNYLQKADKYLNIDFDYQAAGNNLRKECERILKAVLPDRYKKDANDLNGLILKFKDFCNDTEITESFATNLDKYRMVLLNALSHDDEIQVYKKELVDCMNDLKRINYLYTYEFKKFKIRFVNGSTPIEYVVDYSTKAKDQSLILVKDKKNNQLYINNPYCNPYWMESGQPKYMDKEGEEEQKLKNRIKRIVEIQHKFHKITLVEPSDIKDVIFVTDDSGVEKNINHY